MSSIRKLNLNYLTPKNKDLINPFGIQNKLENPFKITPNTSPYDFKYFCHPRKRNLFSKGEPTIGKEPNVESNFKPVSKEANYFTRNIPYIKNKDIKIFRRYEYDNYDYKVDRTKQYDMKKINPIQPKHSTLYKTTVFRGNKFIIDSKKYEEKKSPVNLLEEYMLQLEEENKAKYDTPSVNNKMQKRKPYVAGDSLYKELTLKKNELLSQFSNRNTKDIIYQNKNKVNKEALNGYEGKLIKSKMDNIPITFPTTYIYNKKYRSISERERYEKMTDTFLKLKHLSFIDQNNRFQNQYIKDFTKRYGFNALSDEQIFNFSRFLLNEPFPIDVNKSMKENVNLALSFSDKNISNYKSLNNKSNIISDRTYRSSSTGKSTIDANKPKLKNLLSDMEKQSKLYRTKNEKDTETIYKELTNELDSIKNQRDINKNIEIPLPYQKFNDSLLITQKEISNNNSDKNIDLRLGRKDFESEIFNKTTPIKSKNKLVDMNKRLYYNWIEKQNGYDLNQIEKNKKMTEYIVRERTKRKIIMDNLKKQYQNDLK